MFSRFLVLITLLLSTSLFAGKKHDMCAWDCSDTDENFQKGVEDVKAFFNGDTRINTGGLFVTMFPEEGGIQEIQYFKPSEINVTLTKGQVLITVSARDVIIDPQGERYDFKNFCALKKEGVTDDINLWTQLNYVYAPEFERGWLNYECDVQNPAFKLLFSSHQLSDSGALAAVATESPKKNHARPSKRKAKQGHAHPKRIKQETNDKDPQIKSTASQVSPSLPRTQNTANVSIPEENKATSETGESTLSPQATRFRSGVKPKSAWASRHLNVSEDTYAQYRSRWIDAMRSHQETSHEAAINALGETMETQLTFPQTHQGNHPHSLSESYFQLFQITRGYVWYDALREIGFPLSIEFIQFDNATTPQTKLTRFP